MNELAKTVEDVMQGNPYDNLDQAAKRWAEHSLKTFRGDLLRKALEMSASMVEFVSELKGQ